MFDEEVCGLLIFFFFPHFSLYLKDIKRRIISLEGALKRSLVGQVWPWLFLVHALVHALDANLPWESFMIVCWPVIVLLSAYNPGFHQCEQLCNSILYACWRSYATGGCLGVMVNQPWLHWLHTFSFDQGSSEEGLGCQRLVVPLQLGWLAGMLLGTPSTKWLWGADAFPPWVMQGSPQGSVEAMWATRPVSCLRERIQSCHIQVFLTLLLK